MKPTIRDYRETDSEQFLGLVRDLQRFELDLHDRMMPVEHIGEWYIEALQRRCEEEQGALLVAERDGELIGYATIFARVEQTAEIDEIPYSFGEISHMAVKPVARGAGAGKLLMDECERRARRAGRRWLRINVLANNVAARRIYEHMGFRDHLVVMEKLLE